MMKRRAYKTQIFIELIAMTRLRYKFDLPLIGDNESLDQQLIRAVDKFFEQNGEEKDLSKEEDAYLKWLHNDPSSQSDREIYFRISYWLKTYPLHTKEAEEISSLYKSIYYKDLEQIDESKISKIYREFRKKCRREYRSLRKSKARRIDFSLKDIVKFLPLISFMLPAMFIAAGYLHISVLYGHFDIDTSQFFSMRDYLAGSIEQIRHALYGLVGFALGVLCQFINAPTMAQDERQKYVNSWKRTHIYFSALAYLYLFFVFVPIFPIQISADPPLTISADRLLTTLAIMSAFWLPIIFISTRYFKNSYIVYSFLMALTIFFSSLYTSTLAKIDEIESGRPGMTFEIRSEEKKYTDQDSIFIGSNSRYVFLYHKEEKNTRIIPLTQIGYISLETR